MRKKLKAAPLDWWGPRAFSGFTTYRHGPTEIEPDTAAMIANYKPTLRGEVRNDLKLRVMAILRDGRSSKFENEAACRHGLRKAFCLQGMSWANADLEAASLVYAGLDAIGAGQRPSKDETQPYYATGPDYCTWCFGPMDGEEKLKNKHFCCVECATMSLRHRYRFSSDYMGQVQRSAARLLDKAKAPTRECEYCGDPYHSDVESTRFCSPRCSARWLQGDKLLKDIECQGCGKVTKPATRGSKFCSHSCASATHRAIERGELASVRRQCGICKEDFTPTTKVNLYCGRRCSAIAANRAYVDRNPLPVYHLLCKCCGGGFSTKRAETLTCSAACRETLKRWDAGTGKRLNVAVFDYMLRVSGSRITDALFEAA